MIKIETVEDYWRMINEVIDEDENVPMPKGKDEPVIQSFVVLKYSMMYLISNKKIKMDDPIDEWKYYWQTFKLSDHYKVANAYLIKIGKPPLRFTEDKFHEGGHT